MHASIARIIAVGLLLATLVVAVPAEAQAKGCLEGIGKKTPVLFVHGFNGSPEVWESEGSLESAMSKMKEVYTQPFNYQDFNKRWVTDQNIGPRLAQEIACRAQSSRDEGGKGKVIVIAHSMGGLATQYAIGQTVNGRRVRDDIGLFIPIGTPFAGSNLANWAMTLARSFCAAQHITLVGGKTIEADPEKCETDLDTLTAIGGLRQGSAKLRQLPPIPADLPVRAIAGNVQEVKFNIFGTELKPLDSDLVVTTQSATQKGNLANPAYGGGNSVVECVSVWPVPLFAGASCEHTHMLTDKNVQARVVDAITQYVRNGKLDKARKPYLGEWNGNGQLTLNEDGTGKKIIYLGLCDNGMDLCQVHIAFAWQPTADGLSFKIRSIKGIAVTKAGTEKSAPPDSKINLGKYKQPGTTVTVSAGFQQGSPGIMAINGGNADTAFSGVYCSMTLPIAPDNLPMCGH